MFTVAGLGAVLSRDGDRSCTSRRVYRYPAHQSDVLQRVRVVIASHDDGLSTHSIPTVLKLLWTSSRSMLSLAVRTSAMCHASIPVADPDGALHQLS